MAFVIATGLLTWLNCYIGEKGRKTYYWISIILLVTLSFFVLPTEGMDLYQHYKMLDIMRTSDLERVERLYPYLFGTLPVYSRYFYCVSKLGFNQALLMLTYLINYGLQFALLRMAKKDFNLTDATEKLGYAFIVLGTNAYFLTTVRNVTAFIIFIYFLYWDIVRKRKRMIAWIAYLGVCLLHDSVLFLVVLRMGLCLINKKYFKPFVVSILAWPVLLKGVAVVFSGSGIPFLINIAQKIDVYSTAEAAQMWTGGFANNVMLTLQMAIMLVVLCRVWKCRKNSSAQDWFMYYIMLVLFCIGGLGNRAILFRYIIPVFYMIPSVVAITSNRKMRVRVSLDKINIGVAEVVLLLYWFALGVFQYAFFEFGIA